MSSKAKGRRTIRSFKTLLDKWGWLHDEVELGGRYRKYKDLFAGYCLNCLNREDDCCEDRDIFPGFDLVGIKNGNVSFIQCKTNTPATQHDYREFSKLFATRNIEVWVATKYDYKGFRVQKYKSDGSIEELDLRK